MRFTSAERRNIDELCGRFDLSPNDLTVDFDESCNINGFYKLEQTV